MSRRVLLTGASGFIGSNVLRYMLRERPDWHFVCVSSWRHKGDPRRLWKTYDSNRDRVIVVTHDLTGPLPEIGDFDFMLHLASESHVDRSIAEPVAFIENNVATTLQMLEYARAHPPKVFVQFSTDEVYGPAYPGDVRREGARLRPSSPYAASKACQEMICAAYWRTYGVPVVITNSSNVIGPGQDPEKFFPRVLDAVLNHNEVAIHVTHSGEQLSRVYNPVDNVADALLFVLRPQYWFSVGEPPRFHISGGAPLTNLELAELVAHKLKTRLRYRLVEVGPIRPGADSHYAQLDGQLTRRGWRPPRTLGAYLTDMLT